VSSSAIVADPAILAASYIVYRAIDQSSVASMGQGHISRKSHNRRKFLAPPVCRCIVAKQDKPNLSPHSR
jgi:hypothetical protein